MQISADQLQTSNCLEPLSIGNNTLDTMTLQMALLQLSDWTQGGKHSDFAFAPSGSLSTSVWPILSMVSGEFGPVKPIELVDC